LTKEVKAGEIYKGVVKRMQTFGAFVEILPGKDGLVHVSDMSTEYVKNPEDIVHLNDEVEVRVKEIDDMGRINLSMILDPADDKKEDKPRGGYAPRRGNGGRSDRSASPRRGSFRRENSYDRGERRERSDRDSGRKRFERSDNSESNGPHFPASRLMDNNRKKFNR